MQEKTTQAKKVEDVSNSLTCTCGSDKSLVLELNFFIISAIETNGATGSRSRT